MRYIYKDCCRVLQERVNSHCIYKILIYVQVTGNVCTRNEFTYVFAYHFFTTPFALPIHM